jgi:hypothetical protein
VTRSLGQGAVDAGGRERRAVPIGREYDQVLSMKETTVMGAADTGRNAGGAGR